MHTDCQLECSSSTENANMQFSASAIDIQENQDESEEDELIETWLNLLTSDVRDARRLEHVQRSRG